MRRFVAATALVLGVVMILAPAALHLFSRASAAERLTDAIRPAMTDRALAQTRAEFDMERAALEDFVNPGIPRIAADLGQTPAQFQASIDSQYPAVSAGMQQLPTITAEVDGAIRLFNDNRAKFHSADAIPTTWLPYTVGPWLLIALGAALVLLGAALALGRGGRGPVVALLVLGLFLAVTPFVVRFPQKASDGRQLVAVLREPLSQPTAEQLRAWQTTVEKMTAELQNGLLPATANRLGLSPAGMDAYLARNLPTLAQGLPQLQPVVQHMGALVTTVERSVPTFATTRRLPFRGLTWLFFAPGLLLTLVAATSLMGGASQTRAVSRSSGPIGLPTAPTT